MSYQQSSSSEAHRTVNRGQETPPESNNEEMSNVPKQAALTWSA
jgi:hypothetical protein